MHVEVTRILTQWLKHPVYGVNTLLETVPRAKMNGTFDPKPAKVTIYNDVDFENMITTGGIQPPKMPSIVLVTDENPKSSDIAQIHKSGHVISMASGIGFYAEQSEISKDIKFGNYVLRAIRRSLHAFNLPELSHEGRELNDVKLLKVVQVETQRVAPAVPESYMLGVLFADLLVLDKAP